MKYVIYRKLQQISARKTYEFLNIKDISGEKKYKRVGNKEDGGYVMVDDFDGIDGVLSFGVGDNITWEKEMAKTGAIIEMYDPTVDNVETEEDNVFFYKVGLANKKSVEKSMDSLENILASGHLKNANHMILKMDIEGCEWDVLPYLDERIMKRFKQIVFELHGLIRISPWYQKKVRTSLSNLNKTHQLVHVHANNCGKAVNIGKDTKMPHFLEATYLNKDYYSFTENSRTFPTKYDFPNILGKPEIELGKWC